MLNTPEIDEPFIALALYDTLTTKYSEQRVLWNALEKKKIIFIFTGVREREKIENDSKPVIEMSSKK